MTTKWETCANDGSEMVGVEQFDRGCHDLQTVQTPLWQNKEDFRVKNGCAPMWHLVVVLPDFPSYSSSIKNDAFISCNLCESVPVSIAMVVDGLMAENPCWLWAFVRSIRNSLSLSRRKQQQRLSTKLNTSEGLSYFVHIWHQTHPVLVVVRAVSVHLRRLF